VIPFLFLSAAILVIYVLYSNNQKKRREEPLLSPEQRASLELRRRAKAARKKDSALQWEFGRISPQMICPHCQNRGKVRTMPVEKKRGISGGKATAAVLTGGISVLATGLSRKEALTQAHCDNCNSTWAF
jgi:hypothetical protein